MKNYKFNQNSNNNINNNNCSNTEIIPVITYVNVERNKFIICEENVNKSGVYRLINKINGKSYVGSSISLGNRFNDYYSLSSLTRKIKGSIIIYRALLKYGYKNFNLDVLEYCEPSQLIKREQYYIHHLKPEYNIL
jgi:hypothetical protein